MLLLNVFISFFILNCFSVYKIDCQILSSVNSLEKLVENDEKLFEELRTFSRNVKSSYINK